jgi:protocadherin-16/23
VRSDGRRQKITYRFGRGNEDNAFEINFNNGLIRVRDSSLLDHETKPDVRLVVVARSDGADPVYGYASVTIKLVDANDNSPRFTQDDYSAVAWEGNAKGTFVTRILATDKDSGANAKLSYHIVDGNQDNAFLIEPPYSGEVKTNIVLDREIRDSYLLTVIATDEGSPQRTGTCTLKVTFE